MAAIANIQKLRELGGLPVAAQLPDARIDPHLQAASRQLRREIGDYFDAIEDERADCIDAECSLAMMYLIPVLNMICPESLSTVQKEYGDLGLNFYDANDQKTIIEMWRNRASSAISRIRNAVPPAGVPSIGWNAV